MPRIRWRKSPALLIMDSWLKPDDACLRQNLVLRVPADFEGSNIATQGSQGPLLVQPCPLRCLDTH